MTSRWTNTTADTQESHTPALKRQTERLRKSVLQPYEENLSCSSALRTEPEEPETTAQETEIDNTIRAQNPDRNTTSKSVR